MHVSACFTAYRPYFQFVQAGLSGSEFTHLKNLNSASCFGGSAVLYKFWLDHCAPLSCLRANSAWSVLNSLRMACSSRTSHSCKGVFRIMAAHVYSL
jgi:hypothetical protein